MLIKFKCNPWFLVPIVCLSLEIFGQTAIASPEKSLGNRIFDKADFVFEHADSVSYGHHHSAAADQVCFRGDRCSIQTDCSGFVSYVLSQVAPEQYAAVHEFEKESSYPQARAYAQFIARLPEHSASGGWLKIGSFRDLHRGDIIAWINPRNIGKRHGNTGHVMIVVDNPKDPQEEKVKGDFVRYTTISVIDSSSVDHFQPEQLPSRAGQAHRDGLGKGDIRIILDQSNQVVGYWEGTYWGEGDKHIEAPTYTPLIEFARIVPGH